MSGWCLSVSCIHGWMKALVVSSLWSEVYIGLGMVCDVRWSQVIPGADREQQCPGSHSQDTVWSQKPWSGLFGLTKPGLCRALGASTWRELPAPKALCRVFSTAQRDRAEIFFTCRKKIGINIGIYSVSMSSVTVEIQFCVFSVQFCTVLSSITCKGDLAFR